MNSEARGQPVRTKLRTWLLIAAASVTIIGFFHHVDHLVRGNHSGWPFEEELTSFTFSLLIYALLLPGLYLTWRGLLMAGYWLFAAAVLHALVTSVHFVGEEREAPIRGIYAVYDSPVRGFLAVVDLTVLISSLVVLAAVAIQALRIKGRGYALSLIICLGRPAEKPWRGRGQRYGTEDGAFS
jgi:hypothetical protein